MYREGDVSQALIRLGIDAEQRNSELLGYCPMHLERTGREDHNPSWSMNVETGVHHCFSCGYKGTLLTLVAEVCDFKTEWNRLDFNAAKEWLRAHIEIDLELLVKQMEEARNSYVSMPKPVEMSEARLAVFNVVPDWAMSARRLSPTACELYGVLWDTRQEAWITPIRNPKTGALMGWQEKGQKTRLFRNRPTGVAKSTTMFGLDCWLGGPLLVVESPLDAVRVVSAKIGIHGASTFGVSVSDAQVMLMRQSTKLIVAFDNPTIDTAGEKAAKDMFRRSKQEGFECWFFNYGDSGAKDIGDMDDDQVRWGIENARHCVFGESAIYGK